MIKIPYEDLISKIKEKGKLSDQEIEQRIKEKQDKLSGLVSKEGAAHIVANELGIGLTGNSLGGKLKINEILSGMRDIEVTGKVMNVYEIKNFNSNGREGKVGSILIGDATGTTRLVFWNDQTENIAKTKEGDIIKVVNTYAKESFQGGTEIHFNDRSKLTINPLGEGVGEVKTTPDTTRKDIVAIREEDKTVEVLGTIVQVFDVKFFETCPNCRKRARPQQDKFMCDTHGAVMPDYSYVMNLFLDDSTESIRTVFFRDQLLELTKKSHEDVLKYKDAPETFEDVKTELLGQIIKVNARPTKNQMFDRLELIANSVDPNPNPEEEIEKVKEEVEELKK